MKGVSPRLNGGGAATGRSMAAAGGRGAEGKPPNTRRWKVGPPLWVVHPAVGGSFWGPFRTACSLLVLAYFYRSTRLLRSYPVVPEKNSPFRAERVFCFPSGRRLLALARSDHFRVFCCAGCVSPVVDALHVGLGSLCRRVQPTQGDGGGQGAAAEEKRQLEREIQVPPRCIAKRC